MNQKKVYSFIKKQKVSFICSVDENGFPNVVQELTELVKMYNKK